MTAAAFEGFIDRVHTQDNRLVLRVVAGGFDPTPEGKPVYEIAVSEPNDLEAVRKALLDLKELDGGVNVWLDSPTTLGLQSDHGIELMISGRAVAAEEQDFADTDFKRLATLNHDWGSEMCSSLNRQTERLNGVRELIQQQIQRLQLKAEGHAPGSTARTLYEQHLAFLTRALVAAEA